jgi:uncharacterized protein
MPDGGEAVSVKVLGAIDEIAAADWNACAGTENPFVRHEFLRVLEDSGTVSDQTGWGQRHLVVEDDDGQVVGVAPCYLKSHSYGEYVFDWGWADAFERAGGKYYPKLQVSVPFSPVGGPRLLTRPGPDAERVERILVAALMELAKNHDSSSVHITFCTEGEWARLGQAGLLQRIGQQFHWQNNAYDDFDDFLATLSSRKRKSIRKERRDANALVEIETLTGDALEDRHMEAFYGFYLNTVDRKWSNAYLNREFFLLLRERMRDKVVLIMASHEGRMVGGALNILGEDALYGRNWGCVERFRNLYFEACFYRAIDFAIARGLSTVEAGAQGPHKISRGYLPTPTYSAHWIADPNFRDAVENFLSRERRMMQHEIAELTELGPYRKTGRGGGP